MGLGDGMGLFGMFGNGFERKVRDADVTTLVEFRYKGQRASDYLGSATLYLTPTGGNSVPAGDVYKAARKIQLTLDWLEREKPLSAKERLEIREPLERAYNHLSNGHEPGAACRHIDRAIQILSEAGE